MAKSLNYFTNFDLLNCNPLATWSFQSSEGGRIVFFWIQFFAKLILLSNAEVESESQ